MNKSSRDMLRDFATELPAPDNPYDDGAGPIEMARMMVTHNNSENGSALSAWSTCHQAPDHTWWSVAWVYDTGSGAHHCAYCSDELTEDRPPVSTATGEAFCGATPDGDRHVPEYGGDVVACWWQKTSCPACDGERVITIYDNSTDAPVGWRNCDYDHPAPPPPPVSLVKAHYCDDFNHCPPF